MEYGLLKNQEKNYWNKMERKKKPKFRRVDWNRKPRFNRRAKKIKWRKARGRDSKIREKRRGHGFKPSIGYGMPKVIRGLIKGMKPVKINNVSDLDKVGKKEIAVISSKMGGKKKVDVANKALKLSLKFYNFDPQKFLKEIESKKEEKKAKDKMKKEEKKEKETKAKKEEKPKAESKEEKAKMDEKKINQAISTGREKIQ